MPSPVSSDLLLWHSCVYPAIVSLFVKKMSLESSLLGGMRDAQITAFPPHPAGCDPASR